MLNEDFTFNELHRAIRECQRYSSSEEDNIYFEIKQHMTDKSLTIILQMYNQIYSPDELPSVWKHSIVLAYLKYGKNPNEPNSYRLMSLS